MTTLEIADEFVIAVDWFDVTAEQFKSLLLEIAGYPKRPIVIEMWPRFSDEWIVA